MSELLEEYDLMGSENQLEYLTISEAAKMIGVSEPSLYRYTKTKRIKSKKIAGVTKITKDAVYDYLKSISDPDVTIEELDMVIKENLNKK